MMTNSVSLPFVKIYFFKFHLLPFNIWIHKCRGRTFLEADRGELKWVPTWANWASGVKGNQGQFLTARDRCAGHRLGQPLNRLPARTIGGLGLRRRLNLGGGESRGAFCGLSLDLYELDCIHQPISNSQSRHETV